MPPVIEPPRTGPLDRPAMLHDMASLAGLLAHFQSHLRRLLAAAYPLAAPWRLLATIAPYLPEPLHPRGNLALQAFTYTWPVIRIGRRDDHRHHQPACSAPNRPFAAFDFLVPVKADVWALRGCLATLAVGTAGRRCGPAVLALPFPRAQGAQDAPPETRLPPAAK